LLLINDFNNTFEIKWPKKTKEKMICGIHSMSQGAGLISPRSVVRSHFPLPF